LLACKLKYLSGVSKIGLFYTQNIINIKDLALSEHSLAEELLASFQTAFSGSTRLGDGRELKERKLKRMKYKK